MEEILSQQRHEVRLKTISTSSALALADEYGAPFQVHPSQAVLAITALVLAKENAEGGD
jgi:hypothetical protein